MDIEIRDKLAKAAEYYTQNAELRTAICSIPHIGSAIDVFVATKGQNIIQRRVRSLIENLSSNMSKLEERKVDKEFLRSEEFFELIVRAFEYAARTKDDEKIGLYAQILRGAVNMDNKKEEHFPEEYLEVIKELTPVELKVAKAIYEQQSEYKPDADEITVNEPQWVQSKGWSELTTKCGLSWPELYLILNRIAGTGLIKEIVGPYYEYTGGVYIITPLFKKIMEFIKE